jgi:uncharacterized membrane protein
VSKGIIPILLLKYLGQFNTNYIIFRNVEILIHEIFSLKESKESDEIVGNISFLKMESSKLINYLTNMCLSGQSTTILVMLDSGRGGERDKLKEQIHTCINNVIL